MACETMQLRETVQSQTKLIAQKGGYENIYETIAIWKSERAQG